MRDHDQLVRDLLARGLEIAHGGKHPKVTDGERSYAIPSSPGEGRGHRNLVSDLRRVGFLERPVKAGRTAKRGRRPEAIVEPYDGPRLPAGRIPRRQP